MNVSLVFAPTPTNVASAESPSVDNQGGVFPPLQLMYVAAIIEKAGHKVQILDANAESLTKEYAFKKINEFDTDLIGFSSGVVQWREVLAWARYFKKQSKIPIVIGGPITLDYAKEVLSHKCVDYAAYGFRNETVTELLDSIKTHKGPEKIEGLCFMKKGRYHHIPFTDKKYEHKDLNRLPRPARHLVPNHKYFEFYTKNKNFTLMLTTTGCPYHCSFCAHRFQKWSERPIDDVLDEIEEIYHKFHIREIDFKDNTFTLKQERIFELCNGLRKRGMHDKIRWSCMTRVDRVDDELLKLMSENGCVHIKYGIESGNQRMLDSFSKGTTIDLIKYAIYLTKKHGMEAYGFFQFGAPGETRESALETSEFAINLSRGIFSKLKTDKNEVDLKNKESLCQGCYLANYNTTKEFDMWAHWVLDPNYKLPLRTFGTTLSDEEILNIVNTTYKKVYLSPSYIFKKLTNPNWVILKKGSLAALSMLTKGKSYKLVCNINSIINKVKLAFGTEVIK